MVDSFVEVTDAPGCFARLKDSIVKVGFGFLMIVISFPLLFWNEGRAVKRAQDLEFGRGSVVSIDSAKVDSGKPGQLVHLTGKLTADKPAVDPTFKVSVDAIGLRRNVEMYQWKEDKETEKKGDKNVTTYSYAETWSDKEIDSGDFKKTGYDNPAMPAEGETFLSPSVKLGAFGVGPELVSKWTIGEEHPLTDRDLTKFGDVNGREASIDAGRAYFGTPDSPEIGDVRISYEIGPPGDATIVSGIQAKTLTEFTHKEMNGSIAMVSEGTKTADAMFKAAEDANVMLTWVLRIVGFFLMFMGFNLLFGPIDTVVRMIPLIGGLIDFGTTVIAGFLAGAFSFITISIAWIFYRPLIGILLLVVGLAIVGGGIALAMKAKKD